MPVGLRLILCVALGLIWATPAAAVIPLGMHRTAGGACASDGHADAPSGTPQFAGLLAGVAFPPTCAVAGVGYRVGPPASQSWTKADAFSWPAANIGYNGTSHILSCNGSIPAGTTIDGLDMWTDGGSVHIQGGCNGLTFTNSRFRGNWAVYPTSGGCNVPFIMDSDSAGLTLRNVEIDGNGRTGLTNCDAAPGALGETVNMVGSGAFVFDHVYVHDGYQHLISWGGNPATVSVKHSVLTGGGFGQGPHTNGNQWVGAVTTSSDYEWNLLYDPQPSIASETFTAVCTAPNQVVLTVVAHQANFLVNQHLTGGCFAGTALITAVADDANGGSAGSPPDHVTLTLAATVTTNASTTAASPDLYPGGIGGGGMIRYVNNGGAGVMTNGIISHNVFYSAGPVRPSTYAIECGGDPAPATTINDVLAVNDNHYLPAGVSGGFYTASGCTNVTGAGNTRMDTGATVAVP